MKQRPKLIGNPIVQQYKSLSKRSLNLKRAVIPTTNTLRTLVVPQAKFAPDVIPSVAPQSFPTQPITSLFISSFVRNSDTSLYVISSWNGSDWNSEADPTDITSIAALGDLKKIGNFYYMSVYDNFFTPVTCVLRSSDLITWIDKSPPNVDNIGNHRRSIDGSGSTIYFVGESNTDGGAVIYKSTDDGDNWSLKEVFIDYRMHSLAVDHNNADRVVVVLQSVFNIFPGPPTQRTKRVYSSTDGWASSGYTDIKTGLTFELYNDALIFTASGRFILGLMAAFEADVWVFYSDDLSSYTDTGYDDSSPSFGFDSTLSQMVSLNSLVLFGTYDYAIGADGAGVIYRSLDDGLTWERLEMPDQDYEPIGLFLDTNSNLYIMCNNINTNNEAFYKLSNADTNNVFQVMTNIDPDSQMANVELSII